MSLPRPTIVLFDMDGTTVRHVNPRLLGILEFMDDAAFKLGRLLKRDAHYTPAPTDAPARSTSLLVHRALHKMRKKPVEQIVQPCPGIYAVLNALREEGIPMGVVSNGLGKGYGYDILEKFHLATYFSTRIFREDFKRSKPNPDPLLRALKDLRDPLLSSDVIWYIGDRHKDVLAALAAQQVTGCRVVPFAYGLNAAVAVLEKGLPPDNIIMNYHDFAGAVRELLGKKPDGAGELNGPFDDDLLASFPAPLNDNDPLAA